MLKGKVAFITGSTRGIGWATAELFAAQGAAVILNGRTDRAALEARVTDLQQRFQTDAMACFGDVSDAEVVKEAYRNIFARYKRLDILVNNAGVLGEGLLAMTAPEPARQMLSVNAMSVLLNMQAASRLMARSGGGAIINLASIMATRGDVGLTAYAASKGAVIGMSLAAAKELAASKVRVNVVAPGFIDTDMARTLSAEKREERVRSIRLGRFGEAREVADVILFLASPMSSYVTGQIIGVDGGMTI